VVAVQPAFKASSLLQPVSVTVVSAQPREWPFGMCCSCLTECSRDCGLCCYACWCPSCLGAEIAEKIGSKGCCNTETCCAQWWAACGLDCLIRVLGSFCFGVGSLIGPWVWTIWFATGRDAIKAKYLLPHDELCCSSSCTSFLPDYVLCLNCSQCALYQEAFYLKHEQGADKNIDFDCCIYNMCCKTVPPGTVSVKRPQSG